MMPTHYTLSEAAEIVWTAAKKGRENARDGRFNSAYAYMEGLRGMAFEHRYPESILKIARSAANDINLLLNGTDPAWLFMKPGVA